MNELLETLLIMLAVIAIGAPLSFFILNLMFGSNASASAFDDINFSQGKYRTIIKGTYYSFLTDWDVGMFKGYAVAQTKNKYDEYAIAIYTDRGKHLGYVPKGHIALHKSVLDRGGRVYCCGSLRKGDINSDVFLGTVYIDFDPSQKDKQIINALNT